ncbi:MAG: hypothetical protein P4M12_08750 [Gammaproteobacteria bacterium]|nr:hypothetical protein [Gammaproteobacteria bacterium]
MFHKRILSSDSTSESSMEAMPAACVSASSIDSNASSLTAGYALEGSMEGYITPTQTSPRLRARNAQVMPAYDDACSSSSALPPMQPKIPANAVEFEQAIFEGDSEENYHNFLTFLTSGQSKVYNTLQKMHTQPNPLTKQEELDTLKETFKHKFNFNMQEPYYAGEHKEENDTARESAQAFLTYFWQQENNLVLTRDVHFDNKKKHTETLETIIQGLTHVQKCFQNSGIIKNCLNEFIKLAKESDNNHKQEIANKIKSFHEHYASMQDFVSKSLTEFNDFNNLLSALESTHNVMKNMFSNDIMGSENNTLYKRVGETQKRIAALATYLKKKISNINNNIIEIKQDLNSSCLSFVTTSEIKGKKRCYISISSPQHNDILIERLCDAISTFNETNTAKQLGYYFHIFTEPASSNSQLLLQKIIASTQLDHPPQPFKHCAEKSYITMLAKLSYANNMKISSICNVNFLPLTLEQLKISKKMSENVFVPILPKHEAVWISLIPTCKNCKANKAGALTIMSAASEYRSYVDEKILKEQKLYALESASTSSAKALSTPDRNRLAKEKFSSPMKGIFPPHGASPEKAALKPSSVKNSSLPPRPRAFKLP